MKGGKVEQDRKNTEEGREEREGKWREKEELNLYTAKSDWEVKFLQYNGQQNRGANEFFIEPIYVTLHPKKKSL